MGFALTYAATWYALIGTLYHLVNGPWAGAAACAAACAAGCWIIWENEKGEPRRY